jgi:hypothetical protein
MEACMTLQQPEIVNENRSKPFHVLWDYVLVVPACT